jgi:hypothetical protein
MTALPVKFWPVCSDLIAYTPAPGRSPLCGNVP